MVESPWRIDNPGLASVRRAVASTSLVFRGDANAAAICGAVFGVPLPVTSCGAEERDLRAALWLGPDEWLLIDAQSRALGAEQFATALAGLPHALVDVSSRDLGFEIEGPEAGLLLNACIALDLSPQGFPPGTCARTNFSKCGAMLWRRRSGCFHLRVTRSFGPYAAAMLEEAARNLPARAV